MQPRLNAVRTFHVPSRIVSATLHVLREFGRHSCEGLVLWIGTINGDIATVDDALVPDQTPVRTEDGVGYFVDRWALFDLNRVLSERRKRLIGQVHSHPGEAYHSAADDAQAIVTTEGGLSLVVPDFGKASSDPAEWAIYRLVRGVWRHIVSRDARTLVRVVKEPAGEEER